MTGSHPPPCQGFTFTQVDMERAVLFGGFQPGTKRRVNDVYILNLYNRVSCWATVAYEVVTMMWHNLVTGNQTAGQCCHHVPYVAC